MINKIPLTRINYASTYTLSFIRYKDFFCFTLEPGKTVGKGCISCGTYLIVWEWSYKFNTNLWELKDVPNFTEIKVHAGNDPSETEGCILLGASVDTGYVQLSKQFRKNDQIFLGKSALTLTKFNKLCHAEKITHIEIRDV